MKVSQQEIVAAARELFRARGYAGASMQDLAERVGLKKVSLYSRFPDKEALIGAVLQMTLDEIFRGDDAGDWRTGYEIILRAIGEGLIDRGRCVAFHLAYGISADTPRAMEAVRGFFTTCRRRIAATLSAVVDAKEADRIAADALARIEGATLWLAVDGDRSTMERTLDAVLAEADRLAVETAAPHRDGRMAVEADRRS